MKYLVVNWTDVKKDENPFFLPCKFFLRILSKNILWRKWKSQTLFYQAKETRYNLVKMNVKITFTKIVEFFYRWFENLWERKKEKYCPKKTEMIPVPRVPFSFFRIMMIIIIKNMFFCTPKEVYRSEIWNIERSEKHTFSIRRIRNCWAFLPSRRAQQQVKKNEHLPFLEIQNFPLCKHTREREEMKTRMNSAR